MSLEQHAIDLLVAEATEGLSANDREEMMRLVGPEAAVEAAAFGAAAAAIDLAYSDFDEPMPEAIRRRARSRLLDEIGGSSARVLHHPSAEAPKHAEAPRAGGRTGWWLAAAMLAVAIFGWWPRPIDDELVPPAPTLATAAQRLDLLLARAPDVVSWPWQTTADPASAGGGGEVIWSSARQKGFMRISGLPVNDPADFQYQLWIFDGTRDDRYPIDGGVFDVTVDGEVVVPIEAKLGVRDATLFAVTIETPGGVVVSSRERIVLLAQAT